MTRTLVLSLALLTLVAAGAQADAPDKTLQAAVLKQDQRWIQARTKGDWKAIDQMLAADFVVIDEKGQIYDRAQFLAFARETPLTTLARELNPQVRIYAQGNVAVVTARHKAAGKGAQGHFSFQASTTRMWVKVGGVWKLASMHWSGPFK